MADIGLVGRQGIVDRLATYAGRWRIIVVILLRWMLDTSKEYYDTTQRADLILYLIIACLIVFVQGNAVEIGSSTEYMLLPFRPPLSEGSGDKGYDLPVGQECHVYIRLQVL